jgi:hypothetical protein
MEFNKIGIEVIDVKTDNKICSGMARTELGEKHELTGRTPAGKGICRSAMTAIDSMGLFMMLTEKTELEKNDYFDVTCPHGVCTFRLTRDGKYTV